MKGRRVFSEEFMDQAVEMAMQPGATKSGVARSLGICVTTLAGWVEKYKSANGIADPPKRENERGECVRLRRELKQAKMENEILKKAVAYFAKELE